MTSETHDYELTWWDLTKGFLSGFFQVAKLFLGAYFITLLAYWGLPSLGIVSPLKLEPSIALGVLVVLPFNFARVVKLHGTTTYEEKEEGGDSLAFER